jgi:copper homeostasis protein
MTAPLLEVCVADAESLAAAIDGGADRIELCSALELGGLTPSPGLARLAADAPIPVYAMVRPRSGDFIYSAHDIDVMLVDIDAIRSFGLAGVVLGASRKDGTLDADLLRRLLDRAQGLGSTLHRAFDLVPDFDSAIETAVELGIERILTSGGAATAPAGISALHSIHDAARGRITIMPGAGLTPDNVVTLLAAIPFTEIHSSCSSPRPTAGTQAMRLGFAKSAHKRTDRGIVAAFKRSMAGVQGAGIDQRDSRGDSPKRSR